MTQSRTAAPKANVDDLIAQKMAALARGDRIKAERLESQINSHFSKHSGEPIRPRYGMLGRADDSPLVRAAAGYDSGLFS